MLKKLPLLSHINMFLVRQLRSLLNHSSCSQKSAGYTGLKTIEVYS